METFVKEKVLLEQETNVMKEKLKQTQSEYESVCNELKDCQKTIKSYEEMIGQLQSSGI